MLETDLYHSIFTLTFLTRTISTACNAFADMCVCVVRARVSVYMNCG